VAIEVEDRGLGMQRADLDRVNQLLATPEDTNLDELLRDGRIGLYVVSMIARQHGIVVQLQTNIFGGTQAVIILPHLLIGSLPAESVRDTMQPQRRTPAPEQPQVQERVPLQKRIPLRERVLSQERPASPAPGTPEITEQPSPLRRGHTGSGQVDPASAVTQQIAGATVTEQPARPTPSRPPLPRRRSQTHMAPQLQLGPPRPATEPAVEHQPGLMASFMNGVSQGEADPSGPGSHG
jgi:hypothetical protein